MADTILMDALSGSRLLPLLEGSSAATMVEASRVLVAAGLPVLEVALRSNAALDALTAIRDACPAVVGAGTVLSPVQAERAIAAGAEFIIAPGLLPAVIEVAEQAGVPAIPGVATATEVLTAWSLGLRTLKFFPAAPAGGPPMLASLGAVFRDVQFIPTGGINPGNLAGYLALPNVLACGGSWLAPRALIDNRDFQAIRDRAAQAIATAGPRDG